MRNRKLLAIFGALLTLTVFFGGRVTYKLVSGSFGGTITRAAAAAPSHRDGVTIRGHLDLQVVRAGKVVATWKGHNALQPLAINAMAGCASGLTTAPAFVGKCSGWTPDISLFTNGPCYGWCMGAVATNSGLPAGCNPAGSYNQRSGER